jgi:hypothetical protein
MIAKHSFILEPGEWVGEGTVSFSASEEQLYFITKWGIDLGEEDEIECNQEVRMEGAEETVQNSFQIYDLTSNSFNITLENNILGKVSGSGIIDDKTIAWEFRGHIGFQGYEVYEMEGEGLYKFHAEYASPDQFRTIINGHIRKTEEEE